VKPRLRGRPLIALCAAAALAVGSIGPTALAHPEQHGTPEGHLLGSGAWGDIELLGVARLTGIDDKIADVSVDPSGKYAYLADWGTGTCNVSGSEAGGRNNPDAGVYIVDISDLTDPRQVGFIPSSQDSRPGEGVQALNISTKFFNGTMLVTNNEHCGPQGKGGVTLYDVTNPLKPKKLSKHFGDRGFADAHHIHSAFAWDAGDRAYVVIVDNVEFPDVDILDITNPKRPRLIAEYDLNDFNVDQPDLNLIDSFIHDMVVKEIDGRFIMLVSYWDGGWVLLDVTDPTNAQFLGDTDYPPVDPELADPANTEVPDESRQLTPEGNAHQAEFTADNRFFIGTDEDFAPYRTDEFRITSGDHQGVYPSVIVPGAQAPGILPDLTLNGPVVYGGYGCPDSAAIPTPESIPGYLDMLEPGEEKIVVLQRGPVGDPSAPEPACFPGQKAHEAVEAGWDAVLFVNHHAGAAVSEEVPFCGSGAFVDVVVGVCTNHQAFHALFDLQPISGPWSYPEAIPLGTIGAEIEVGSIFDGWGYVHLYDANSLQLLDTYAVPEAHDPNFAFGFGDLTVHEVATHPTQWDQAYLSYYAAGLRSLEIQCSNPADTSTCELVETGGYLDEDGNDFWGVEVFVRDGRTIVLGSDRDSGLWIFEDTQDGIPNS
jgi:hypothetical protein